jgi:hypothetical protein
METTSKRNNASKNKFKVKTMVWKTTSIFFENGRRPQKIMQPKTIKSKNNGCGTAPGNLVISFIVSNVQFILESTFH